MANIRDNVDFLHEISLVRESGENAPSKALAVLVMTVIAQI